MGPINKIAFLLFLLGSIATAQMQKDYLIHNRGMLHQTVYNTGARTKIRHVERQYRARNSLVRVAREFRDHRRR
jgi:hypothetical protein